MYLFELVLTFPLDILAEVELLDHMVVLFNFEDPPYCFPYWFHQFIISQIVHKCPLFSTSTPPVIFCLFEKKHSNRCEVISHAFDLHFFED